MRIGELSQQTGTPTRMLRYYEEQGLLESTREPNGYRLYDFNAVDRVRQVRGLIDSGVPTSIIKQLTPCLGPTTDIHLHDNCPELVAMLEKQHQDVVNRIECLTRNRDAIGEYLETVRSLTGMSDLCR